jgi:hypothetical protein
MLILELFERVAALEKRLDDKEPGQWDHRGEYL